MHSLDDLRLLCAVAARQSFSETARVMDIPKGTLSRRIARLEQQLGQTLLLRSTRSVRLSELGERLVSRLQPLFEEADEIQRQLLQEQQEPAGTVTLRLPLEFAYPQFSAVLQAFLARYPRIALRCHHYLAPLPPYVEQDDLSFVVHEEALPASEWIARPLMSLRQAIYAAPALPLLSEADALSEQACITQPGEQVWRFRNAEGLRQLKVSGRLQLSDPQMRLQSAIRGLGYAKLPAFLGDEAVRHGSLRHQPLDAEPLALNLALLYRSRHLPAKARAFLDFFQSNFS